MERRGFVQGAVGAVVVAAVAWALPDRFVFAWLAGLLWLTIGIYVGIGLMDSERQALVQITGGLPIVALLLAAVVWPWLLVLAWLLHPVWDMAHHLGWVKTRVHPLVVPFCIVFDVAIAGVTAAWVAGWL